MHRFPFETHSPSRRIRKWPLLIVAIGFLPLTVATGQSPTLTPKLRSRLKLRTPVSDELLYELEKDFVDLLRESDHVDQLLEAEDLLVATDDSSHWTNYSAATQILRRDRDIAAIPLLLRYIVLHSKRSSRHVMIPEYRKTIVAISGHEIPAFYQSGPDTVTRMRSKVRELVNGWWRGAKKELVSDPDKMSGGPIAGFGDQSNQGSSSSRRLHWLWW